MHFNIADLFESVVDTVPDRLALVSGDTRLSFRELDHRANRVGHFLSSRGIKAGDHVGICLYNGSEFLEAMLGIFKIRAVPINVNYRYVADELRYVIDNADLRGLFLQRELTDRFAPLLGDFPELGLLVHAEDGSSADCGELGSIEYEEALSSVSQERDFPERSADDLYIIYTGGTTGMPKGVMWRHEDVFFAGLQGGNPGGEPIERPQQLAEIVAGNPMAMTTLPVAPFIHGAAQWGALIGWFGGGKVVLCSGRSMDPERIWRLVGEEKVNVMTIVGDAMARPLADALCAPGADYDTSSLIVIGSAGAVFSETVKDQLRSKLETTMFVDSFGSSESGHSGSMTATRSVSESGHPRFLMSDTVTIIDENHRPIEPGSGVVGYLARRGWLPLGYYKDPEKTAKTFIEIDGERWVIPGDMGTIEADGTITMFGRGSVCINSGGEKIFPEEVEEVLKAHSAIEDAIVVGVPDERWGQRVAAVLQARGSEPPKKEDIETHCRAHIAGYKVPRQFHLVDKVGRQPSGKPDYKWAKAVASGEIEAGRQL